MGARGRNATKVRENPRERETVGSRDGESQRAAWAKEQESREMVGRKGKLFRWLYPVPFLLFVQALGQP